MEVDGVALHFVDRLVGVCDGVRVCVCVYVYVCVLLAVGIVVHLLLGGIISSLPPACKCLGSLRSVSATSQPYLVRE